MSEIKARLKDKKAITPLWIVALFVSLTETVLGVAVTQTTGGIQIALTAFVILFPLLIAGFFFSILWFRPYVFYPPTEFGQQTGVIEYVEAMQRRPSLLKGSPDTTNVLPSDKQKVATDEIVELFLTRISPAGFLVLYAYYVAFTKKKAFNYKDLIEATDVVDYQYGWGFIVATKATGLIGSTTKEEVTTVVYLNEKLQQYLKAGSSQTLEKTRKEHELDTQFMENFSRFVNGKMSQIEQFFG